MWIYAILVALYKCQREISLVAIDVKHSESVYTDLLVKIIIDTININLTNQPM